MARRAAPGRRRPKRSSTVDQEKNGYARALVAEGDFYDPSEEYGHEDYGASGTSTLPTPTYETDSYTEATVYESVSYVGVGRCGWDISWLLPIS